jgi:hypothetical protein
MGKGAPRILFPERLDYLKARFRETVPVTIPSTDYTFVGTRQGKRLEVELTAKLD